MGFTDKEKVEIEKAKELVMADMHEIFKSAKYDSIVVLHIPIKGLIPDDIDVTYLEENDFNDDLISWDINIADWGIELMSCFSDSRQCIEWDYDDENDEEHDEEYDEEYDEEENEYKFILRFVASYPEIKKRIMEACEKYYVFQDTCFNLLRKNVLDLSKTVGVEFNLPESTNQYKMVVREENGKKIGTIDLGDKMVEVITKGDIALTSHCDKPIQKVKIPK